MKSDTSKCERHEELLDYLYQEMSSTQRVAYERHLNTCATCTTELEGLGRLRTELRAWDVLNVPALEIVIPRSPWLVLKECFMLFPAWGRGVWALSSAAALLLMAFGAFSLLRGIPSNPTAVAQTPVALPSTISATTTLTPEVQAQISATVAKAVEQAVQVERQALRAEMASYETRAAEQQTRVQTVARQLRSLQARHDALLAEQQPSLRRLMAEYNDAGNER